MKANYRILIPTLAAVAISASAALAQMPGAQTRTPGADPARQAQFCADMTARQDARFTYLEDRLKLTPTQKPLFDKWKAAEAGVAAERQAACAKPRPAPGTASLTQRNERREERLKTALAALEKTRGPEEALYNALDQDQKQLLDHGGHRMGMGRRGRGVFGHGPRFGFGGRGAN